MTTTAMGVMGLLTVLIPLLLLIHPLLPDRLAQTQRGATLIVFLLWILTIVATRRTDPGRGGGEQRHRLHELFSDEARDELRDREIDRMQEWVAADTVSVIADRTRPRRPLRQAIPTTGSRSKDPRNRRSTSA